MLVASLTQATASARPPPAVPLTVQHDKQHAAKRQHIEVPTQVVDPALPVAPVRHVPEARATGAHTIQ